jgi:mannobiose 2-epimerase
MIDFKEEVKAELTEHIIPFWINLRDDENGGFYGSLSTDLELDKKADKGIIAHARILWTFSAVYNEIGGEENLKNAKHAYEFLINKGLDKEYKGFYWMLDYKGNKTDTRKHIYVQSFCIYALSEYYRASKNEKALEYAIDLYNLVEDTGFDKDIKAYREEFNREWEEAINEMLSENGVIADITMNTHLHVLEAYTNLYLVWQDEGLKKVIENLIYVFYEKIYDKETKFLKVFLNKNWQSIIDLKSFGHDIEASWLIDDAIKAIGLKDEKLDKMIIDIAYNIGEYAIQEDGSLINEEENSIKDFDRVWWVQAEAVIGFLNIYEKNKDELMLTYAKDLWTYIKDKIIDKRPGAEWYQSINAKGNPTTRRIVEPWKAPYHNGRFCLEIMKRG